MRDIYPLRSQDVAYRIINDKAILVALKGGKIYSINSLGARIWEKLDGTNSLDEIATSISKSFKVEKSQVLADSFEFIEELKSKGILKEATKNEGKENTSAL